MTRFTERWWCKLLHTESAAAFHPGARVVSEMSARGAVIRALEEKSAIDPDAEAKLVQDVRDAVVTAAWDHLGDYAADMEMEFVRDIASAAIARVRGEESA